MKMVHLKDKFKRKATTIVVMLMAIGLILLVFFNKFKSNEEKVYVSEQYSSSGNLIGTNEYVMRDGNPIVHGKFINYNEKGIKIAEGQFIDGEINGICSYYYDNGEIESVFFRKNSKITLESIYYYPNGKIKKYVMFNDFGEPKFMVEYNENGVTMSYEGSSTYIVNQYKYNNKEEIEINAGDTLKLGDVIKFDYLLPNIPNTERTFTIEIEGVDSLKSKRIITKELPTRVIIEETLVKKGLNRIKMINQYKFNDNVAPTINDTIPFDIYVR